MAPDGTAGKVQRSRSQVISRSYDVASAGRGQLARPRGEQNAKSRGSVKLYRSLGRPFAVAQPQLTRFVSGLLPAPCPILTRNSEFCRQIAPSMRTGWAGHLRTDGLHTCRFHPLRTETSITRDILETGSHPPWCHRIQTVFSTACPPTQRCQKLIIEGDTDVRPSESRANPPRQAQ